MQICSSTSERNKKLRYMLAAAFAVHAISIAAAIDFPQMPSVTAPSIPELSSSSPFQQTQQKRTDTTPSQKNSAKTDVNGLNLTAKQISSLGSLDLLGAFSGNSQIPEYLSALTGNQSTSNTDMQNNTLNTILQQLSKIANQTTQTAGSVSANTGNSAGTNTPIFTNSPTPTVGSIGTDSTVQRSAKQSQVLRFRVNGSDILGTCTTLYFSDPTESGLFLLTGDRTVLSDKRKYNETFYLLFKPDKTSGGAILYEVEADIMQESDNINSYLYRMTQKSPFTAVRTGNLVSLKANEPDWKLDLLIDLQGKQ